MQRLRAIEEDWSTINDMRQDFESTKAKLKTLMHRELAPQIPSMACPSNLGHADHACIPRDTAGHPQAHRQQQWSQLAHAELRMGADLAPSSRRGDDVNQAAGAVAVECPKPYSQLHRYEQRLKAREAEAEAAELRSEVLHPSASSSLQLFLCCRIVWTPFLCHDACQLIGILPLTLS